MEDGGHGCSFGVVRAIDGAECWLCCSSWSAGDPVGAPKLTAQCVHRQPRHPIVHPWAERLRALLLSLPLRHAACLLLSVPCLVHTNLMVAV